MEHTKEPWSINLSHIYAPDGEIIAVVNNPGSHELDYPLVANARRIVACVNACKGLDNEFLEKTPGIKYELMAGSVEAKRGDEMQQQRDELLACIQRIAKLRIVEVEEITDDYLGLFAEILTGKVEQS